MPRDACDYREMIEANSQREKAEREKNKPIVIDFSDIWRDRAERLRKSEEANNTPERIAQSRMVCIMDDIKQIMNKLGEDEETATLMAMAKWRNKE